jgi:hypothetical protein
VSDAARDRNDDAVDAIRDALRGMRYGELVIQVHDGAVVQVVRSEKVRLPRRDR